MSRRSWSDAGDTDDYHHFFKLIEIPYSPFHNEFDKEEDDQVVQVAPQRRDQYAISSSRQEYLRSYTFSRKQTVREQVKSRLGRIKAAAWAVVACNCRNALPRRARRLVKEKLALRSSRSQFGSQRGSSLRPSSSRAPFLPQCFRVTTM